MSAPWVRQTHRWSSLVFSVVVLMNFGAMALRSSATWVGALAIPPLLVLMGTGLTMFVRPYLAKPTAN